MEEIIKNKSKLLLVCFLSMLVVLSMIIPAHAATKSISTDRGTMEGGMGDRILFESYK